MKNTGLRTGGTILRDAVRGAPHLQARYRAFGALRLALAFMVMLQHFGSFAPAGLGDQLPRYMTGSIAVLVFFVLSGYVIAEAALNFYQQRPTAFAANRFLRIFPQYVFAVFFSFAVHAVLWHFTYLQIPEYFVSSDTTTDAFLTLSNFVWNLLFLLPVPSGANAPDYSFIPYAWAIRTEVLFYIFVAAAIGLGLFAKCLDFSKAIFLVGVVALVGYVAWRLGVGVPSSFRFGIYFSLGSAFYYAQGGSRFCLLITVVFLIACLLDFRDYELETQLRYEIRFGERLWGAQYVILTGSLALFAMCAFFSPLGRMRRVDKCLGDLSYPLYLNQYSALIIFTSLSFGRGYLIFFSALATAVAFSVLADLICEPVIKPLRDKIRGTRLGATRPA